MSWSIGLQLSESVIELSGRSSQTPEAPLLKHRSFYPQGLPGPAVAQFFAKNDITDVSRVEIVTNLPLKILEAGHGSHIAVLTTLGFENWLEMNLPLKTPFFTNQPERQNMPIDREFIFGVQERTNASGHIEKLPDDTDLEFLTSKLQMHEISKVAICFLHSNKNPENEKRVAQYFQSRGFWVDTSHSHSATIKSPSNQDPDEKMRFWSAVANAYTQKYYGEILTSLANEFEKVKTADAQIRLGAHLINDVIEGKVKPLDTAFSLTDHMGQKFAKTTDLLYCGVEDFVFFKSLREEVCTYANTGFSLAQRHWPYHSLRLQPNTKLDRGFFSDLSFSNEKLPFDPGPMLFGRGLSMLLFDLLFLDYKGEAIQGVTDKFQDRGRQRLTESLAAYARNMADAKHSTRDELAHKLLTMAALSWRSDFSKYGFESEKSNLTLCGPLASVVHAHLGGQIVGDDFFVPSSLLGVQL
jgi:hypothetical protein